MTTRADGGRRKILSLAVAVIVVGLSAGAIFVHQDVVDVPVERLVANLEGLIAKEPGAVQHRVNLARVHAMAFALKSGTLKVAPGKEAAGPAHAPLAENVQPKSTATADPARLAEARQHLQKSIRRYQEAIELDPKHALARLGHGWVLQQAGESVKAIESYRAAIELAWPEERTVRVMRLRGWVSITEEAGRLLIPLLDPVKDKAEIAQIQARTSEVREQARAITPIAVPLRDGLTAAELCDNTASVEFDADGTGLRRRWTWITPDAAWLVFDPRRTGTVRSALQMFGNVTFWLFWRNGYEAMRALDDDGDGRLRDRELHGLALWRDADRDAISDPGEVLPLARWQIVELSVNYEYDVSHPDEIAYVPNGVVFADGSARRSYDLLLRPSVTNGETRRPRLSLQ